MVPAGSRVAAVAHAHLLAVEAVVVAAAAAVGKLLAVAGRLVEGPLLDEAAALAAVGGQGARGGVHCNAAEEEEDGGGARKEGEWEWGRERESERKATNGGGLCSRRRRRPRPADTAKCQPCCAVVGREAVFLTALMGCRRRRRRQRLHLWAAADIAVFPNRK